MRVSSHHRSTRRIISFGGIIRGVAFLAFFLLLLTTSLSAQEFVGKNCARYTPMVRSTSFVLVLDRSGSFGAGGLINARNAVESFVSRLRPEDEVAMVSFASDVKIERRFTNDPRRLNRSADELRAGGGTRLYDALAAAVRLLRDRHGVRVVIYITDGDDNRSSLTLDEIRQMNVGENVIVYGLGLGDVNHDNLRSISRATNGGYGTAANPGAMVSLYDQVQAAYYQRFDDELLDSAGITVTSLPAGRPVYVNGRQVGETPYRLDGLTPAEYGVTVEFDRGSWSCTVDAREGYRASLTARERDVPLYVTVETAPTRAAVFINGDYVGISSMVPSQLVDGSRDISEQLVIPSVPPGEHTIKVVAAPELDFSPNQVMEFPVSVIDQPVYVKAYIFNGVVENMEGEQTRASQLGPGEGSDIFDDIRSRVPGGTNMPGGSNIPGGSTPPGR